MYLLIRKCIGRADIQRICSIMWLDNTLLIPVFQSGKSGHMTRQYTGTNISYIDCPTGTNDLESRCVDHFFGESITSKALEQVSEWKWKKYHICSIEHSTKSMHYVCGIDGFCCRNTQNFCPVGALEPIRDFDSNSAVWYLSLNYEKNYSLVLCDSNKSGWRYKIGKNKFWCYNRYIQIIR